ncbi:uncharacterized protein BO80DRAFT_420270 [Aspergillus ibericus CBS 121593]|uniref:Uncharacterized protein n=1 Tax=Aspergillus ibericus CBS 121593 TaxID=1448316 RepID=A0A395GHX7_9EURO|nr:hypothetical protein BO80DRAFT_420270 [Aspergillus ibericus CBS 121593]RAK94832.1 hypothetical protein BO80DRAFT_420270 [Aspergillus ibericus CBS 121593]
MQRALFTEEEVRLATERRSKYLGTAKVSIYQIHFDPPLPRELDPKNVDRLCEIFRKNQCRRLDVDNHVPAIVSRQDLADALRKANIPQPSLLTNDPRQCPRLGFGVGQLRALHGRHRVQAGATVLPPTDRWWTVDLYEDDIGEELRTSLVEEYANQKKPTDGEIYRKIRQYEGEDNEAFRERWFVRLSSSNQDRLDQLDNKRNRRVRRAFDRLLPIPGLWPHGMRISVLHRLIATGCVEEILNYLNHVRDFWSSLVASDPVSMKKIDLDTVDALQLLAPGKSRADAKKACGLILSGQAFAEFSEEERRIIWSRMKDFDGLIPSLYTFFEDFKYLESCAQCVKRLFGPSSESVWATMRSMFVPPLDEEVQECLIQTSESTFRRQRATDVERLDMGYLQVWLYAMRHYPLMPPDAKNDDDLLAKPARAKADERAIYEMAELARRLGFKSPEIDTLIDSSPDHQIARAALLQARKPNKFRYDAGQFDVLVNRIVDCFAVAVSYQPDIVHDTLADSIMKPRARCGMPQTRTHKQDGPLLFLDRLQVEDAGISDTITSFFVRRCVYIAFFGKPAQPGPAENDPAEGSPGGHPGSPLFVEEDALSGDHESAPQAASPETPPRQEREEPRRQRIRQNREHRPLRYLQTSRVVKTGRGVRTRRRRARKAQLSRPIDDQEPLDSEWQNADPSDQVMSDHEHLSQELSDAVSEGESSSIDSRMAFTLHSIHDPDTPEETDTHSRCTRLSAGTIRPEQDLKDIPTPEAQYQNNDFENQVGIDRPLLTQSTELEDDEYSEVHIAGRQQVLDEYLDQLMRAQEEQERLEEEIERERLEEELGLSNQERPISEMPFRAHERQVSSPRIPANEPPKETHNEGPGSIREPIAEPTRKSSPVSDHADLPELIVENPEIAAPAIRDNTNNPRTRSPPEYDQPAGQTPVLPDLVEISFWTFEREEWRQSDRLRVNPSDPSPVERVARKYSWKSYSLYDKNLQSLSPAQCYRAATADDSNTIFLISEPEEQRLAAEGRLNKDRQLLSLVSRVLNRAETEPKSPNKRHRPMSLGRT